MISWSGCLPIAALSCDRERDRLTVDRDDHVVGFDAGSVGRLAVVDRANVWVSTLDIRPHVIQEGPQDAGCLIDVSFLRAGRVAATRSASARCWLEIVRCANSDVDQIGGLEIRSRCRPAT